MTLGTAGEINIEEINHIFDIAYCSNTHTSPSMLNSNPRSGLNTGLKYTPLHYAARKGVLEIVELLVRGISPSPCCPVAKSSVLMYNGIPNNLPNEPVTCR
jgi:hypothetical protein